MKRYNEVSIRGPTGRVRAAVEIYSRFGSYSPKFFMIIHEGRRITPFEQRLRGWSLDFGSTFTMFYTSEVLRELINLPSWLEKLPADNWGGAFYTVPT